MRYLLPTLILGSVLFVGAVALINEWYAAAALVLYSFSRMTVEAIGSTLKHGDKSCG